MKSRFPFQQINFVSPEKINTEHETCVVNSKIMKWVELISSESEWNEDRVIEASKMKYGNMFTVITL